MIDDPVTAAFGLAVAAAGVAFRLYGVRLPESLAATDEEEKERDFLERQASRRSNVAIAFMLCGGLLFTSGIIDADANPTMGYLSFALGIASVPLLLWAIAVAVGDAMITRTRAAQELRSVQTHRQRIEQELAKYRAEQRG